MIVNDNKIIKSKNTKIITKIKIKFINIFKMVNIKPISLYLNMKVDKNCKKTIIKLFQLAKILKVLEKYHFDKAKLTDILMKKNYIGTKSFY